MATKKSAGGAPPEETAPTANEAPVVAARYISRTHLLFGHPNDGKTTDETEIHAGQEVPARVIADMNETELLHHVAAGRFERIEE